ncbi:MAG: hypothetical protein KGO48_04715 [Alphaproteobacteria bacterium]|nr:hypothetical protein [Alphaproteobacteria bacterium]
MIGKASVFAFALLAPGIAFAADSAATAAAPAAAAHDTASTATNAKSDAKTGVKQTVAKAKTHKTKAGAAVQKKADQKS